MPPKLRHPCERCGFVAELERAGRFRDEDFLQVFHELMELEAAHQHTRRLLELARRKLEDLQALVPTPDKPDAPDASECPF